MPIFYGQVHGKNWGVEKQPTLDSGTRKCVRCSFIKPLHMFWWEGDYHKTCRACNKEHKRQKVRKEGVTL